MHFNAIKLLAVVLLSIMGFFIVKADETYTKYNGLYFRFRIPETKIIAGAPIFADIIVSNSTESSQTIWYSKTSCGCGFANFSIIEESSGREVKCSIINDDVTTSAFGIQPHRVQVLKFDLGRSYSVTNSGSYLIRASFTLPLAGSKSGAYTNFLTRPILINLASKNEALSWAGEASVSWN